MYVTHLLWIAHGLRVFANVNALFEPANLDSDLIYDAVHQYWLKLEAILKVDLNRYVGMLNFH